MEHVIANLLRDFEKGKLSRRELIRSLALTVTAASVATAARTAEGQGFKAVAVIIFPMVLPTTPGRATSTPTSSG